MPSGTHRAEPSLHWILVLAATLKLLVALLPDNGSRARPPVHRGRGLPASTIRRLSAAAGRRVSAGRRRGYGIVMKRNGPTGRGEGVQVARREAPWMRGKVLVAVLVVLLASAGRASAGAATWGGRYTVRAGDSLSAIAQRYHVSLSRLADANRLDWRKTLLIGLVLRVPASGAQGSDWGGTYIVRPGDTLSGIALRYHVSLGQIAAANAFDPAKVLLIGTRLRVPTSGATSLDLAHLVEHNPYRSGQVGFDISYPNCAAPPPDTQSFTVIGLNAGRPFTTNPCFAGEWAAARPPRSVYINTAYSPTLARHITSDCAAAANAKGFRPPARRAYAVGCSEAAAALEQLARHHNRGRLARYRTRQLVVAPPNSQRRRNQGHTRAPTHQVAPVRSSGSIQTRRTGSRSSAAGPRSESPSGSQPERPIHPAARPGSPPDRCGSRKPPTEFSTATQSAERPDQGAPAPECTTTSPTSPLSCRRAGTDRTRGAISPEGGRSRTFPHGHGHAHCRPPKVSSRTTSSTTAHPRADPPRLHDRRAPVRSPGIMLGRRLARPAR